MKSVYWLIAGVMLVTLLAGCVPQVPEGTDLGQRKSVETPVPKTLQEYERSIDYSCESDEDCIIKDVGNCCGVYPRCLNKDANTYPGFVKQFCAEEKLVSICGFKSISSCECVSSTCVPNE